MGLTFPSFPMKPLHHLVLSAWNLKAFGGANILWSKLCWPRRRLLYLLYCWSSNFSGHSSYLGCLWKVLTPGPNPALTKTQSLTVGSWSYIFSKCPGWFWHQGLEGDTLRNVTVGSSSVTSTMSAHCGCLVLFPVGPLPQRGRKWTVYGTRPNLRRG